MTVGLDRNTGRVLTGVDHLIQSIGDILTTPIGTRVMRRDYGCAAFEWIDAPMNEATKVDIYAAVAEALDRWEPRFKLERIVTVSAVAGKLAVNLIGRYLPEGREITVEGVVFG